MKSWGEQIDELVVAGSYLDALSLLDTLDVAVVPDKVGRVFASTSFILTSRRFDVTLSSNHCMRSRYSRTGSMTKLSTSSSNSIPIHQKLFRYIPNPSPVGSPPPRRIGLSYSVAQRKRSLSPVNQNLRKG